MLVVATREPATFLGYVLLPGGLCRLPKDNVDRFVGRLRALRQRYRTGTVGLDDVERRVGSWVVHAAHADSVALRHGLFRGGMFDPFPL